MVSVEKMKYYFDKGLWSIQRVEMLLQAGKITRDEYEYIIGNVPETM